MTTPKSPAAPRPLVRVLQVLACVALGAVIGLFGTTAHRMQVPDGWWTGIVLALALTLAATVLARSWAGFLGLAGFGLGWIAMVQLLSLQGPGGDVMIPAGDTIGYVWSYGGLLVVAIGAFLPRVWFADSPRPRRATAD